MFWDRIALGFGYAMMAAALGAQGWMITQSSDQVAKAQASLDKIALLVERLIKLH